MANIKNTIILTTGSTTVQANTAVDFVSKAPKTKSGVTLYANSCKGYGAVTVGAQCNDTDVATVAFYKSTVGSRLVAEDCMGVVQAVADKTSYVVRVPAGAQTVVVSNTGTLFRFPTLTLYASETESFDKADAAIDANLPDNRSQLITAKRLRDTLHTMTSDLYEVELSNTSFVTASLDNYNYQYDELNEKIEANDLKHTQAEKQLTVDVSFNTTQINQIKSNHSSDIQNLQGQITTNKSNISANEQAIRNANARIDNIEGGGGEATTVRNTLLVSQDSNTSSSTRTVKVQASKEEFTKVFEIYTSNLSATTNSQAMIQLFNGDVVYKTIYVKELFDQHIFSVYVFRQDFSADDRVPTEIRLVTAAGVQWQFDVFAVNNNAHPFETDKTGYHLYTGAYPNKVNLTGMKQGIYSDVEDGLQPSDDFYSFDPIYEGGYTINIHLDDWKDDERTVYIKALNVENKEWITISANSEDFSVDLRGVDAWVCQIEPPTGDIFTPQITITSGDRICRPVGYGQFDDFKTEVDETYAKKNGAYEELLAGSAMNIQGTNTTTNDSKYRTSGGTADIGTGVAEVRAIKGQSIVWNQLAGDQFQSYNSNTRTTNQGEGVWRVTNSTTGEIKGDASMVRLVDNQRITTYANHKYYVCGEARQPFGSTAFAFEYEKQAVTFECPTANTWVRGSGIVNGVDYDNYPLYFKIYGSTLYGVPAGSYYEVRNLMFIDLTAIYGFGLEPTSAAQFEADFQKWFGKPLEYKPKYLNNVINSWPSSISTVGFNLVKPNNFKGTIRDWYNGGEHIFDNNVDYNGQMYIQFNVKKCPTDSQVQIAVRFTDGTTQSIISSLGGTGVVKGKTTANKKISYIWRSYVGGTVSNEIEVSDICVNFSWSGKRDGDYETHWDNIVPMDVTKWTGKLNGEGESVIVFPDGMNGVGDFRDEIRIEGGKMVAIKRVKEIMAANIFKYDTNNYPHIAMFRVNNMANQSQFTFSKNYVNAKCTSLSQFTSKNANKSIYIDNRGTATANNIYVNDLSCNAVSEFQKALAGEIFYQTLETPEVYVLDDNITFPIIYKVDDFGTERQDTVSEKVDSFVTNGYELPAILEVLYSLNAADTLNRMNELYISADSMRNFISALSGKGISLTMTYNSNTGQYEFR